MACPRTFVSDLDLGNAGLMKTFQAWCTRRTYPPACRINGMFLMLSLILRAPAARPWTTICPALVLRPIPSESARAPGRSASRRSLRQRRRSYSVQLSPRRGDRHQVALWASAGRRGNHTRGSAHAV